jgi:hypothetical protein
MQANKKYLRSFLSIMQQKTDFNTTVNLVIMRIKENVKKKNQVKLKKILKNI